ncbi:hypothetical protein ACQKKX_04510 [Neorhizobium sp. NPDC001467]|uniref:hypothetical protein n=1 Tax=Neorhizobium sp. NPDC001467 TaxID=3390595 RepID=UPI003D05DA48
MTNSKPPSGWGTDPLTQYLEDARGNQFATFDNKRRAMADLIAIDRLFLKLLHSAVNPDPKIPMFFLLRAHAAYRAATSAVMAGQLFEVQALLRLCLEHAGYGHFIGGDIKKWERWMSRTDSKKTRKAVRDEFTAGAVKASIKAASAHIAQGYETLYEQALDYGAHPNETGFSMSSALRRADDRIHFDTVYLHSDGLALDFSLRTTAQVGLCVLRIGQLIYPTRYELQGIRHDLDVIRQRY